MKAPSWALILILLVSPPVLAGGASRTRPGGSGGGGGGGGGGHASRGSGSSTAVRPSGGAPTRVSGQATYGYGSGGGYAGYPGYPYYGYGYGWGWYGGWGWGWDPWYSYGVWWPPATYSMAAYPETLTLSGSRSEVPAVVETDIQPGKASVRVDGEEVGRAKDFNGTWDRLTVAPGSHVLELAAPGYLTLRTTVRLEPGRFYRIEQDLKKGEGIDPRSETASAAPASFAAPDTAARTETSAPEPGSQATTLRRGFLKIAADPPDAAVYLDGEFLASARELAALHGAIPVAVGEHNVEVIHPKLAARSLRVDVAGSDPVHVDLRVGEQR